jgi:hypothetical protein
MLHCKPDDRIYVTNIKVGTLPIWLQRISLIALLH